MRDTFPDSIIDKGIVGWWVRYDPDEARGTFDGTYDSWRPTLRGARRVVRKYQARLVRQAERAARRIVVKAAHPGSYRQP